MTTEDLAAVVKKERQRSPNYPAVGLREAVERVRKLIQADGKAGAPPEIAAKHIGYSSAHGQAMSVLAALKKFGLVAESGGRLAPTQGALEIVNLPEADSRRKKALREAALSPALYVELAMHHADTGLPSPDVLEAELTTYKGFNPKAVAGFVKDFLDTLDFAGITVGSKVESRKEPDERAARVKVGDHVQWVSQGAEQFQQAKRVTGFSEDGTIALVENEKTGFPVEQLEVAEAPTYQPPLPVRRQNRPDGASNMRNEVFSLDDGGEVVITWPSPLPSEAIEDIKAWLRIVERKISRSGAAPPTETEAS